MEMRRNIKEWLFVVWFQPWFPRKLARVAFAHTYKLRGQIPWSLGFVFYKWRYIDHILKSDAQFELFAEGAALPPAFGFRLDERVIEIPWIFSRIAPAPGRFLDAGSALNHEETIARLMAYRKDLTIMTLAPERQAFWDRGISYHFGDLCALPFRDQWFDEIACISTLEHVGMDNLNYGESGEPALQRESFQEAARELWRVLKPGGALLITVPFGKRQDVVWSNVVFMQQFDPALVQSLVGCFDGGMTRICYYQYHPDGWQLSDEESCRNAEYFNMHESAQTAPDFAAAARAVACLEIRKKAEG